MTGAPLTPAANLWREAKRGISTSEINLHCQSVYLGNGSFTAAGLIGFNGGLVALTAAVRSTSFLLLRMKQASASSILRRMKKKKRDMNGRFERQPRPKWLNSLGQNKLLLTDTRAQLPRTEKSVVLSWRRRRRWNLSVQRESVACLPRGYRSDFVQSAVKLDTHTQGRLAKSERIGCDREFVHSKSCYFESVLMADLH